MFFTAIALNYAKAFKVKNKVIDYLEDNEVIDVANQSAAADEAMTAYFEKELLGNLNYRVSTNSMDCTTQGYDAYVHLAYCQDGIKITQIDVGKTKSDGMGVYYRVETYFTWNIPFLRQLLALDEGNKGGTNKNEMGRWKISGETRTIINNQE